MAEIFGTDKIDFLLHWWRFTGCESGAYLKNAPPLAPTRMEQKMRLKKGNSNAH